VAQTSPTVPQGGRKKPPKAGTTQRVSFETLSKIKTVNYHLFKSKGVRISQAEVIERAIDFAFSHEAEFIEYVSTGNNERQESTFDTLVRVTGQPWFPYGNIFKID
jgi:hypothetical protein